VWLVVSTAQTLLGGSANTLSCTWNSNSPLFTTTPPPTTTTSHNINKNNNDKQQCAHLQSGSVAEISDNMSFPNEFVHVSTSGPHSFSSRNCVADVVAKRGELEFHVHERVFALPPNSVCAVETTNHTFTTAVTRFSKHQIQV